MSRLNQSCCYCLLIPVLILVQTTFNHTASANPPQQIESIPKLSNSVYTPIPLPASGEIKDVLSERDIPIGDSGFARGYSIQLTAGDQIAIELTSEAFDTVVVLLNAKGRTIGVNDDGSDGTTNSLLFARIIDSGTYIIRVRGFGENSHGEFRLKVSKLKPQ